MEKDYKKLDQAVSVMFAHIYSLSKEKEEIKLIDFSWDNLSHRGMLHCAFITSTRFGFKIYIRCRLIDFIKVKLKYRKHMDIYFAKNRDNGIICDKAIGKIEKFMNEVGIMKEVYETYYE